jgi:O-antigen ligase
VVFTIVIFGSVVAAFAIFQKLVNPDNIYGIRETVQAHTFGPFVNGHHFAALMEMTMGLSFGLFFSKSIRKEIRALFLIGVFLMGLAVFMTGSRGGILSVLGVLGFVTIFDVLRKKSAGDREETSGGQKKLIVFGGALTFGLLMIGIGLTLGGETALRSIGLDGVGGDVSNGRGHFWYIALQIFKDNILLGVGLDAFGVAFTHYDTWNGAFRIEQAHNDYLQIMADAGIPGLLCVIGFIYFLFRQGLKTIGATADRFHRAVAIGALAGCFGVLIHSFFDFPLRTPANMLVFLTLAALAIVSIKPARP